MQTEPLHALQIRSIFPFLVRIVSLMLLDMPMTIAGQEIVPLINVAQVVQIASLQLSTRQNSVWEVTSSSKDTLWQCISHAELGFLEWSVLMIAHKTQVFHAVPIVLAQCGAVPIVMEASASAIQEHAV